MATKKEIIADRRRKGVPKTQLKRGLDGEFINGTATGPFPPPPKTTIRSLRAQLDAQRAHNSQLYSRIDGLSAANRRLQVQLDAMVDAAVRRGDHLTDDIPF